MKKLKLGTCLLICCLLLAVGTYADNIVFVTSGAYTGNLGGLAGADSICQNHAAIASLPGNYRALLSSLSGNVAINAGDRIIHSSFPYRRVDGTIVANNWGDFTDGTLAAPIVLSETGQNLSQGSSTFVWSGTSASFMYSGACSPSGNFVAWSGTSGSAAAGILTQINSAWIFAATLSCASFNHLYCIQQVPEPSTISGRVLSASGRGITQARIVVSGGGLPAPLIYYTNRYGNYVTAALTNGVTYTLSVSQRRFTFSPSIQNVTLSGSNIANANFTANP